VAEYVSRVYVSGKLVKPAEYEDARDCRTQWKRNGEPVESIDAEPLEEDEEQRPSPG
jgi:hypothetical protein